MLQWPASRESELWKDFAWHNAMFAVTFWIPRNCDITFESPFALLFLQPPSWFTFSFKTFHMTQCCAVEASKRKRRKSMKLHFYCTWKCQRWLCLQHTRLLLGERLAAKVVFHSRRLAMYTLRHYCILFSTRNSYFRQFRSTYRVNFKYWNTLHMKLTEAAKCHGNGADNELTCSTALFVFKRFLITSWILMPCARFCKHLTIKWYRKFRQQIYSMGAVPTNKFEISFNFAWSSQFHFIDPLIIFSIITSINQRNRQLVWWSLKTLPRTAAIQFFCFVERLMTYWCMQET